MALQQSQVDARSETRGSEQSPEEPHVRSQSNGVGLYVFLLALQTAGVVVLVAKWIPLYRAMAIDFAKYAPDPTPWWVVVGTVVSMTAYGLQVWLRPPLPERKGVFLGQIILFVARVSFVSVTAGFTVMFLNRFESLMDINYSPIRILLVLVMFFSVFCWTTELERLAVSIRKRSA